MNSTAHTIVLQQETCFPFSSNFALTPTTPPLTMDTEPWSSSDIDLLKSAARKYSDREKNDRWRKVGQKLNRPKRECYEKYKELKRERDESGSRSRPSSSSRSSSSSSVSSSSSRAGGKGSSKYSEESSSSSSTSSSTSTARSSTSWSKKEEETKDSSSAAGPPPYIAPPRGRGTASLFDDDDSEEEDDGFRIDWNAGAKQQEKGSNDSSSAKRRGGTSTSATMICSERDTRVLDAASRCSSSMIQITEAADIRKLLFGDRTVNCFNKAWTEQGFYFNDFDNLRCGLVQNKGGPCGVIAAVQAHVLKLLLFGDSFSSSSSSSDDFKNPTRERRENALLNALAEILWRIAEITSLSSGRRPTVTIALVPRRSSGGRLGRTPGYKPDGLTETLLLYTFTSYSSSRDFLDAHLKTFMEPNGKGTALYTYSLILTRGIEHVRADMDTMADVSSLIGRHDYAAQELVNLMLCGRAHSNVFNGKKDLGGMVLRGIPERSDIGMLTLFEHYGHVRVGSNLKLPQTPVWVLCSESHYSVLFSDSVDETRNPLERRGASVCIATAEPMFLFFFFFLLFSSFFFLLSLFSGQPFSSPSSSRVTVPLRLSLPLASHIFSLSFPSSSKVDTRLIYTTTTSWPSKRSYTC